MEPMPAASAGWYARVDGGYNWFVTPDSSALAILRTPNSKMDGAWSVGGGIGYYFGTWLPRRHHGRSSLRCRKRETAIAIAAARTMSALQSSTSAARLCLPTSTMISIAAAASIRISAAASVSHTTRRHLCELTDPCGCTAGYDGKSSNSFAAAAMAGVSWRIRGGGTTYVGGLKDRPVAVSDGNALYLDFGYRFLYLGQAETGASSSHWRAKSVDSESQGH